MPEASIRYVPADVLDPWLNGGQTLLYYTGMTRLAKNILQNVVGRYLDRDRQAMAALGQLGVLASRMAEAMGRKDIRQFGRMIDRAWNLNLQLDPQSTTPEIEELLARIRPYIYGAKLLRGRRRRIFAAYRADHRPMQPALPACWMTRRLMLRHNSLNSGWPIRGWK